MSEAVPDSEVAVVPPRALDAANMPNEATPLSVRSFGLTDRGKVRTTNQDQFLIAVLRKAFQITLTSLPSRKVQYSGDQCHLFVVADGMGGHAGGEQASALAIDSVEAFILSTFKWFTALRSKDEDKLLVDFQSALSQANARLLAEMTAHPELRGMGTTLTLAYSLNDRLFVAHVGDSRGYLLRQDVLHRLTSDHTLVEEMVRRGMLSAEEATTHRLRHVITNVVGGNSAEVKVELHNVQLEAGDVVLLCSDGLTNMVADDEIAGILQQDRDCERACRQLVARANAAGGKDNITAVVAQFEVASSAPGP